MPTERRGTGVTRHVHFDLDPVARVHSFFGWHLPKWVLTYHKHAPGLVSLYVVKHLFQQKVNVLSKGSGFSPSRAYVFPELFFTETLLANRARQGDRARGGGRGASGRIGALGPRAAARPVQGRGRTGARAVKPNHFQWRLFPGSPQLTNK